MSIYQSQEVPFIPTYLYIKQHSATGKLYFGKTIQNPVKYPGSGKHWKPHYKLHGKENIETLWYCLFTDKEELVKFALGCSEQWDIVKSDRWLNFIPENGIDGGCPGVNHSPEHIAKIVAKNLGMKRGPHSPEHNNKLSLANKDKKRTIEQNKLMSIARTGLKNKPRTMEQNMSISAAITARQLGKKQSTRSDEVLSKLHDKLSAIRANKKRGPYKTRIKEMSQIICPHCLKEGGSNNMKRYHFDNCKQKSLLS